MKNKYYKAELEQFTKDMNKQYLIVTYDYENYVLSLRKRTKDGVETIFRGVVKNASKLNEVREQLSILLTSGN